MAEGSVIRSSDGIQVYPCQSVLEPGFIEYINWIKAGGEPDIVDKCEPQITDESPQDQENTF